MENVSLGIANLLKEKGFKQPTFKVGQFWYYDEKLLILVQVSDSSLHFFYADGSGHSISIPVFRFKYLIFAPSCTDILPIVGCFLEYDFVMQKFGIGFDGVITFFDNAADGLALFWLNSIS